MNVLRMALLMLLLSGCSSSDARQRDAVLDNLEASIRLPAGAKPLNSYVRYYAPAGKGQIAGILMLPGLDELPPGEVCEQLREDMTSEPCTFVWPKSTSVGAGNRVWLSGLEKLPMPARDGGHCSIITFGYRTSDRRFLDVTCYDDQQVGY
jgi:hypothetical protein